MSKVFKNNPQQSKLILEELEERRLFSGGIEGLIASDLDSDANAIYREFELKDSQAENTNGEISAAEQQSQEIVFVDAGVDNYQQLVDDLRNNADSSRNIEVVVLDRDKDGIEEISEFLSHREDLDAIHIISHGSDGSVELGNTSLNAATLEQNNLKIALWANNFADTGDILIYGCNLAGSEAGQSLIEELGALTLTDVAASTDLTGHADLGGDWQLEFSAGSIEARVAVSENIQANWQGSLAVAVDNTSSDTDVNTSSLTVSHTTSGSDRLVLVSVVTEPNGGESISSMTYGGVAMTNVGSYLHSGSQLRVELWAAVGEPATGTHDVVINLSAQSKSIAASVTSFTGVDQGSPLGTFVTAEGDGSTASVNVASATGDMVFGVASVRKGVDATPTGGASEIFDASIANVEGAGSTNDGAPSVSTSWTLDVSDKWIASGISINSADVASVSDGTAIWRDASTTPQTSDWDGSSFGPTTATAPSGDYRIMQGAESPMRDEIIVIGVTENDEITGEIWDGSSWSVLPGSLGSPLGTVGQNYWWGMDVQYESQSGDALMVWTDGGNIEYATWNGSSWSGVNTIAYSGATPRQLQLAASPNSDEMVLVVSDSNSQDFALVWDGSSWGNEKILEQVAGDDRTDIFVAYEQQSGQAMVVYGKSNIDAYYQVWNGTSWEPEGSVSQAIGASGNVRWTTLASDPNSDRIALGVTTSNGDTWLNVWDGSGWSTSELATTSSTGTDHPAVAVAFESTSGGLLAAYGESGSSDVKYRTWTLGGGWTSEQVGPNIGGTPNSLMLSSDPTSDNIMLAGQDSNSDVNYVLWNGTNWGTPTELGTSTTETKNQPFLFLWDQAPGNTAPTFIDGAVGNWNFDEGSGDSATESAIGISAGTLGSTTGADVNDPTWTTGKFGQALHFDGVDDYVEIADAPGLDISGPEFSASLWMNPDSGPNQEDMLFMKGDRQGNINYYLSWKNSNEMTWAFKDGAGWHYQDMPVTMPTTGQWNHIGITFDRPTVTLYVNGTKYVFDDVATGGSMDRDLTANNEVLWIGAGRSGGSIVGVNQWSGPFTGSIDELALFDRALTDADMEAIRTGTPPVVTASAFSIDENSANDTVVGTVAANDPDAGDTLSYAITAGNTGGAFSIDANGVIKVANSAALDFETNPVFNLTVEATDDGSPNLADTTTVAITLNNVAPTISASGAATVNEGETYTLNLSATEDVSNWTINWGDGTIDTIAGNLTSATHVYTVGGLTNNITISATDADGTYFDSSLIIGNAASGTDGFLLMAGYDPSSGLADIAGAQILNTPTPSDLDWAADVIVGPNGDIYATGYQSNNVVRFDGTTGAFVEEFITMTRPVSIAFGPDGNLYVASDLQHVKRFDGTTGAYIDDFISTSYVPEEMTFGADGNLYVGQYDPGRIYRYDGITGAPIDGGSAFIDPESTGTLADDINHSEQFAFGPDGNIYVASIDDGKIQRYDGTTGAFIDTFATPGNVGAGWPDGPTGVAFGPDGHLYVTKVDRVERYDGTTGAYIDDYIPTGSGLDNPWFSTFTPNHQVYVSPDTPAVISGDTSYSGNEGDVVAGDLNATDVEGLTDGTYFTVTNPASNGAAAIDATTGAWTFTPTDANWFGSDSFVVTVTDDLGGTTTQLVSITLASANDAPVMTAWFNDAWDTRKGLTISSGQVAGDVSNFPVLITLNTDAQLAAQALANGDDIVFTAADGTTQLAHEIEFFDETTGELRVWVKTDLSGSVDTSIYMYFGNAASGNQENIPGVWDNYVGVYHLGESPTGAAGEIIDSSGSGNHATTEGAMDGADSVATTIGQGLAFDGTDDMIRIPDSVSLDGINDEATFSLWINFVESADGVTQIIMSSEDRYTTGAVDGYEWASQGDGDHFFYPDAGTPDTNYNLGANPFTDNTWQHLAATMDFTTKEVKIYIDGSPMTFSTEGVPGSWTTPTTSSGDLLWGGNPDRATRYFLGMMDEIRIADVARSQEWIQTEVNNQKTPGTFFSVGATEDREDKLTDINEDDFTSAGDSVLSIINSSGADRITDDDVGAVEGIAVTAVDDTNGQWQYDANADGSWLAFGAVTDTNAVLLDTGALIRFVPNADYNGSAGDLTFHAWDQTTGSNGDIGANVSTNGGDTAYSSETFDATLNVIAVDDAAVITGDISYTGNEGDAVAGDLNATDVEGLTDTTYFTVTTLAANGTAAIDPATGAWTFTPTDPNWFGSDNFTVTVTDDLGGTTTQLVSVTLNGVNDAGSFGGNTSATTDEDTATAGTVTFADAVDGFTTANFSLNMAASNGVAAIDAAGNWTYTPTANYNGADSFTVQVTDDDGNVETQVISITVTQIDDAGTFGGNTSATTNEDTATAGTVTFADTADGFATANFSLNTAASNGVATIDAAGNWTYTPTANYNGADSFTVQVTDDDGNVETQVISLTVTQIDDAGSFGGNTSATTNEDTATAGTVTFADTADGFATANFSLNTAASNGVAAIDAAGNWTYTPTANYNGADSFTVQVTDDDGNVETQVISLTVTQIDDTGTFGGNTAATTNEDTATAGTVTFADTADGFTTANFSLNTAASNGVAAIDAAGNWTYTPTANYNGADSFTVQVTDDDGNVETQVISLTVTAIDDAGTFGGNTSATTNEDTATAGTVTFADTADGFTTANFSLNTAASNGVAAIDAAGNWTYTPTANYNGADSFTVQVTDDDGNVETQVISLTVTQIDDTGTFGGNTAATTNEDTATAGTVTFADVADGFTTPNFSLNTAASNGVAAIDAAGNWTYTPTANYNGADSFTVQVTDDDGHVETQVISITVTQIDDTGTFGGNTSATTNEDTATAGTVTFADTADGFTTANFSLNTAASNGVAAIDAAGNWTYTPTANYNGADSFTVQVTDDDGHVETQVISLTVTAIDDAGTFGGNTAATTNEDTATAGTVTFADTADGFTTANFSLNTAASNGVAAIDAAGNWTYTPTANYNGADSFTVQVTDDDGHVETQVISLTVTAIDDAGTFGGNTAATTNEDTATAGTVTFADTADGFATANFSLNTAASNGVAAIDAAGNWTYTPTANYNGADSFTVQVTDDDGHVETQVISLTVTAIDDAGTFGGNTSATTNEDTATAGTVTFADVADGFTTPNFSLNTAASNGVAAIDAAGNWTYTPTANYNGADSFTVQVTDDDGNVETQVISLTVTAIDDAGTFGGNTAATTNEDTATAGTVTFSDTADGFTTANFSLNTAASNGVAAIDAAGNWTYTPTANYNGADSFTVQVTDDDGHVETQVISLTVTPVNNAGTFGGNTADTTNEDTAIAGTVTFADAVDGFTTPNFSLNTAASNGVAAIDAAGNWTYTPTANYNGSDSFTVQVTDDDGNVETQVISLTVTAIDDAGTFGGNTSATTNEDTATAGTVTFSDTADGFTTANFSLNTAASNGVAAIDAAGNWTYTPTANYNGADSFTVQVTDDDGHVETQVISLTVTAIDDAGTFGGNTSATTNEDTATAGTVTFADVADGFTTPNFSLNTAASNGVAAIDAAGNWTYTPTANYNGADSFTVQVTDDDGHVETQVISLTVTQIDDAGTFGGNTSATTNEDTATAGTVTFADAADGFTTANFSLTTAASNGTATINAAGDWTYTPTANFNGSDSFTVQVTDDDGHVETQVISLTVTQIDDAGTFGGNTAATTNEDTATAGTVTFADAADGFSTANFTINTAATNGVAAIDAAGNWTYTPTANYNGADSFTVQVTDDDGHVETQVISLTVTPIDDAGTFGGDTAATTNEDTATAGTVTFADAADGFTTANFSLTTAASNGTATINAAGDWTYTPTANFNGSDSFTVQVTDDDGHVETQVISLTVTQIDDAGTFGGNTSATTNEDTATAGTVTFADAADGFTTANFSLTTAASNGVAAIDAAGNWTYTPTANYNGADSFTVQVTDDDGHVETQVISITVTAVNDAPVAVDDSITAIEDTPFTSTIDLDANDTDLDGDALTVVPGTFATTAGGSITIAVDGSYTYTPAANFNGADSVNYTVTDGSLTDVGTLNITVTAVNNAPVIGGVDTGTITEDLNLRAGNLTAAGVLTIADPDAGESSFIATTVNGALGALTIDTAGNWRYSADNGNPEIQALQSGESITDTLTVTTVDGTTHDVVITINGAAEAAPPPPPPVVEPPIVEPPPEAEPPPEEETETGGGVDPVVDDIVRAPQDVTPPAVQEVVDNSGYLQQEQAEADKAETSAVKEKYVAKIIEQPQAQAIQQQAIQQRNLSLDELSLQVSDDEALNEKYELELLARIDSMHNSMDGDAAQTSADDVDVQIVMGSTASLTAGIVSWVLRGGSLLASFMSTVPLLNRFDPLPILKSREEKEDVEEDSDDDDSDTKFKKHQKRVDNMFSGKDGAREQNRDMNE